MNPRQVDGYEELLVTSGGRMTFIFKNSFLKCPINLHFFNFSQTFSTDHNKYIRLCKRK